MKNQSNETNFINLNLYATLVVSEFRVVKPKNEKAKAKGSLHMKGYLKSDTQNKVRFDLCVKCEEALSLIRENCEILPFQGEKKVKTEVIINACIGGAHAEAFVHKDKEYVNLKGALIKANGIMLDGELIHENENCDFDQEPTLSGLVYMNHIREDEDDAETLLISGSMPEGRAHEPNYHRVNLDIPKQASLLGSVSEYWPQGYDSRDTNLIYCAAVEVTDIDVSCFTYDDSLMASMNGTIETMSYLKIGDKVAVKKGKPTFKVLSELFVDGFKEGWKKGGQPKQKQDSEVKPTFKNKAKTIAAAF